MTEQHVRVRQYNQPLCHQHIYFFNKREREHVLFRPEYFFLIFFFLLSEFLLLNVKSSG